MKKIITTKAAPEAIGPYSQAVMAGGQLFISGQIALDPVTGEMVNVDIAAETGQILKNLGAILRAAGMGYADVVQATVYLRDLNDFAAMNAVYGEFFKDDPPARATVEVSGLPKDARVEMAFIAVKN
ncbi:MAG: RidA family protein [Thermodesulfobacteriota bacterium]|nr:RidA family protein [Thermodesulfobacteriota bacterium]